MLEHLHEQSSPLKKKIHVMYRNETGKYILLIFLIFGMPVCLIENVEVTDQTDI